MSDAYEAAYPSDRDNYDCCDLYDRADNYRRQNRLNAQQTPYEAKVMERVNILLETFGFGGKCWQAAGKLVDALRVLSFTRGLTDTEQLLLLTADDYYTAEQFVA